MFNKTTFAKVLTCFFISLRFHHQWILNLVLFCSESSLSTSEPSPCVCFFCRKQHAMKFMTIFEHIELTSSDQCHSKRFFYLGPKLYIVPLRRTKTTIYEINYHCCLHPLSSASGAVPPPPPTAALHLIYIKLKPDFLVHLRIDYEKKSLTPNS